MIDIISILRIATPFGLSEAPTPPIPPTPVIRPSGGGGAGGSPSAIYQSELQRMESIRSFKRLTEADDEEVILLAMMAGMM